MFTSLENQPISGYSDYFVIDISEMAERFHHEWDGILLKHMNLRGHHSTNQYERHGFFWQTMDLSKIISEAFACIKQEHEVDMSVGMFAYRDVQASVLYNFHQVQRTLTVSDMVAIATELSGAAERLGFSLYQHLKLLGFYHNGFFPYHFCGWYGGSVLVGLDESHGGSTIIPEDLRIMLYEDPASYPNGVHDGST